MKTWLKAPSLKRFTERAWSNFTVRSRIHFFGERGAELSGAFWCDFERWSGGSEHICERGEEILTALLRSHALAHTTRYRRQHVVCADDSFLHTTRTIAEQNVFVSVFLLCCVRPLLLNYYWTQSEDLCVCGGVCVCVCQHHLISHEGEKRLSMWFT